MITQGDSAEKKMGKDGLDLKELREAAIYYFVTNTAIVRDEGRCTVPLCLEILHVTLHSSGNSTTHINCLYYHSSLNICS